MTKITFCINTTYKELDYLKLLFQSLELNLSTLDHEIIVFIDGNNQPTFDWLSKQKETFPALKILYNKLPVCYGYARNINEMFMQASNSIVSYLQSDMVVCKDYDLEILKNLEPNMILCSTRIEPPLHGFSDNVITNNFGLNPGEFDYEGFTKFANQHKQQKVTEYFFAPFTLYKDVWLSVGGHDTLFRRSREDSDVLTRLVLNNVKIIQVWNALVYHFTCTSSRGVDWFNKQNVEAQERVQLQQVADQIELEKFVTKWGQFTHNLNKSKYFNVSAHIKGYDLNLSNFATVQCYFKTIYVDDINIITLMDELYTSHHTPANKLLNISADDWKLYGYIYNTMSAYDRFKGLDCMQDDDVIVSFDLNDITPNLYQDFICKIQDVVGNVDETGEYQYGPFHIKINRIVDRANEQIVVKNPVIKPEHLYSIH